MSLCPYCRERPLAKVGIQQGGRPPVDCGYASCRRDRRRSRRQAERDAKRQAAQQTPGVACEDYFKDDTPAEIERKLAAARAARKYQEWRAGQRRYAVDPWQQRSGRSAMDGEVRLMDVGDVW